ncbi:MAG TPA: MerR family transcriptional regulator [Actinomycetota bacterium]|jgi:DNA-binding transcriptional MerR regulator|nr:MerR family transcriptional regulator [Actinomycetota bacterium]
MEGFTAEQACRYTGCTPHQLRYWDRINLVRPSVQSTGGRPGVRRLYSFRDLVQLKVIASLLDGGMSLQRVRRAYDYLRKKARLEEHLSSVRLISDGSSIFDVRSDGDVADALKEGQLAFFLAIDQVATKVDRRVSDYLYDREEFVQAVRKVGGEVERQLDHDTVRRLRAGSGA